MKMFRVYVHVGRLSLEPALCWKWAQTRDMLQYVGSNRMDFDDIDSGRGPSFGSIRNKLAYIYSPVVLITQ